MYKKTFLSFANFFSCFLMFLTSSLDFFKTLEDNTIKGYSRLHRYTQRITFTLMYCVFRKLEGMGCKFIL
jgi:hypothetical protein